MQKKFNLDQLRELNVEIAAISADIVVLEEQEKLCITAMNAGSEDESLVAQATQRWRDEAGKAFLGRDADVEGALKEKQLAERGAEERRANAEGARAALPQVRSDKATLEIKRAKLRAKAYPPASLVIADRLGTAWAKLAAAEAALELAAAEVRGIVDAAHEVCSGAVMVISNAVSMKFFKWEVDELQRAAAKSKLLAELAGVGVTPGKHLMAGASDFDELAGGGRDAFCAAVGKEEWRVKYSSAPASGPAAMRGVSVTVSDQVVEITEQGQNVEQVWAGPGRVVVDHGADDWAPGRVIAAG